MLASHVYSFQFEKAHCYHVVGMISGSVANGIIRPASLACGPSLAPAQGISGGLLHPGHLDFLCSLSYYWSFWAVPPRRFLFLSRLLIYPLCYHSRRPKMTFSLYWNGFRDYKDRGPCLLPFLIDLSSSSTNNRCLFFPFPSFLIQSI